MLKTKQDCTDSSAGANRGGSLKRNGCKSHPLTQDASAILELLHEVGNKVASAPQLTQLAGLITQMTQQALSASASSILLLDEGKQDLLFKIVEGKATEPLRQARLSTQSGVAGWVARNGRPLILNNVNLDNRFDGSMDEVTGFTTKSIICVPLIVHRRTIGVIEVLNKKNNADFSRQDLEALESVASTAALSIENIRLHQIVLDSYSGTIKALAATIDAKDPYTQGHSRRVTEYAMMGASNLGLSKDETGALEYASILHDIGKIGIADVILTKPGALTDDEWDVMRGHPAIGAGILDGISFLDKSRELILHHHERFDGTGYPNRLKGKNIPLGARLLAVADAFDTMTTDRSYRPALGVEYAFKELADCSGTQFCPTAVWAFTTAYSENSGGDHGTPGISA